MSSSAEEEEEDEGQEQGESSKHRSSSQTGAQRQQQRSGGARPKEEKKARKSFTKLGFKPVENVQRVCIRRNGTLLTIEQPDVLKSSTSNQHYVVFGEAKLDDASAVARRMPPSEPLANDSSYGVQPLSVSSSSPLFSVQGSSLPSSGSEPAVPPAAVAPAFPVSSALPSSAVFAATAAPATPESGDGANKSADTTENGETEKIDDSDVSLRDVQLVCSEAGVTQKKAARALRDNGHDVVAAMLEF
jgi:NACalpha-BTF3-like transcription factor